VAGLTSHARETGEAAAAAFSFPVSGRGAPPATHLTLPASALAGRYQAANVGDISETA